MVIGSNESFFLRVDVPFDSLGQNRPQKVGEIGQNRRKIGFSGLELVRARTFEQKVTETWL